MENNLNLLSVGDAALDSFIYPAESEAVCELNSKECRIAFKYGAKIPIKTLDFSVGGNAANNAVGSTRLGVTCALVSTMGDDIVGGTILERLKGEGVETSYVVQQIQTTSNYSVIVGYMGERTIFVYHAPRSYEFPVQLPASPWVYLTSMGESFLPFYNHMLEWLDKNPGVKLAFNPGTWQLKGRPEDIAKVLARTQVIFVNREEAMKMTNTADSLGRERELILALSSLGPKVCIITDGPNGSYAYDSEAQKFFKCPVLPVDAYERTGAGDSFGTGTLAAIIKGKTLDEALLWGTVNSASVIGYIGSQKGLLKEADIPDWLERARSSGVKVEGF